MRKALFIAFFVYLCFLIEFFLFNTAGQWLKPNLLLILVVYFNLAFGIRYSIFAAVLAGALKDSFSTGLFGLNIFAFVVCAYATTVLKRYLHYVASRQSRLLLVFCVTTVHVAVSYALEIMTDRVDVLGAVRFVFVPEAVTTLLVTSFAFSQLKRCVLKLFA